jgi:hypothetical protein
MARHEGIDPDQVRDELFPAPIDVTNMEYDDLVAFIKAKPHRINELKDAVMNCMPRGDLIGPLERAAASFGYIYKDRAFVLAEAVTSTAGEHAAPSDEISAAGDQVAQAAAPMAETQATADDVDAEQLADQMAEVTSADSDKAVQMSARTKKAKATPSTKANTGKAAAPAPATKPTKGKTARVAKAAA